MRKFLTNLSIFILVGFSFFYTEKITYMVNNNDSIMIELKQNNYNISPIEPIIKEDTIIPGVNGLKLNVKKSYQKMKKYGAYNENLNQYDIVLPNQTLNKNKNKYIISGNSQKKMVSFLFIIEENSKLEKVLNILEKNNIKSTFFIDGKWLEQNGSYLYKLKNHIVGNNALENDTDFIWVNTTIANILNQTTNYCIFLKKSEEKLNMCYLQNNYSILPNIVIKNDLYQETKENVKSGSLILINITQNIIDELNTTIIYLKSKGYTIIDLKTHLES